MFFTAVLSLHPFGAFSHHKLAISHAKHKALSEFSSWLKRSIVLYVWFWGFCTRCKVSLLTTFWKPRWVSCGSHFHWLYGQWKWDPQWFSKRRRLEVEYRWGCTLSLTSALGGSEWLAPCSGRFTPRKETRYQLYMRLGRRQDQLGRVRKILPPTGIQSFDRPAHSIVAISTELSRPLHPPTAVFNISTIISKSVLSVKVPSSHLEAVILRLDSDNLMLMFKGK
jgi:hypothetical protein